MVLDRRTESLTVIESAANGLGVSRVSAGRHSERCKRAGRKVECTQHISSQQLLRYVGAETGTWLGEEDPEFAFKATILVWRCRYCELILSPGPVYQVVWGKMLRGITIFEGAIELCR